MRHILCSALLLALAPACGGGDDADAAPHVDARIPAGKFHATWTINGMSGQTACDSVGAERVGVKLTNPNNQTVADSFSCASVTGISQDYPPDDYRFSFELQGHGVTIATVDAPGTTAIEDGQTAEVPPVDFTVSTQGGFSLMLDANAPGLNCDPETAAPLAGAGITAWQLLLRTPPGSSGVCVPATFTVDDGTTSGTTGGTYTLTCPGPTMLPCFENDQKITFSGLPPAAYELLEVGLEGAEACYPHFSQVDVVGGDNEDMLGAVTIPLDTTNTNCVAP